MFAGPSSELLKKGIGNVLLLSIADTKYCGVEFVVAGPSSELSKQSIGIELTVITQAARDASSRRSFMFMSALFVFFFPLAELDECRKRKKNLHE